MNQILPGSGNLSLAESWLTENQIYFSPTRAGKSIRFSNAPHANPFESKIQLFLGDYKKSNWVTARAKLLHQKAEHG